jgi:hypothetical protein
VGVSACLEVDSASSAGAPAQLEAAAIAAGVDALRRFDLIDLAEGWVSPAEIARALPISI